ncbi:MAG: SapC family protein [Alphaproteobacteria bacterium]
MESEDRSGIPELVGGAPLYRRPEPLNPIDHGNLGLIAPEIPFAFAAGQHFVPLLYSEFVPASTSYPVIFAGEEKTPLAVMGLQAGGNLFVPGAVNRGEVYVPAYLRRYPFVVANASTPGDNAAVICIDRESPLIGENPTHPFYQDGANTEYTNNCIKFCQDYENERMVTLQFVQRLKELDLFDLRSAKYNPPPELGMGSDPVEVAGYYAIDSEKLNDLPVETYIQFRDQGLLPAIFAHWASQTQWDRIVARSLRAEFDKAEAGRVQAMAAAAGSPLN